ncbi:unnamed protein product [Ophioblennius macclurei]
MAEDESSPVQAQDAEPIVNRWVVDYYVFQALQSFEKSQHEEFCSVKLLLDQLLTRPVENNDGIPVKIKVLQFVSRINECEKPDVVFDHITPLESALLVLEDISHICDIPQHDFKQVSILIKEMIVGLCIKSKKFDKAKEMLQKHFPKPMVGKKAIFMGLIKQESINHKVIEQINFQRFKEDMMAFCQTLCYFGIPFLYRAAKQLIEKRRTEQDNRPAGPDEDAHLSQLSKQQQQPTTAQFACRHTVIQRTRLEAAYNALAVAPGRKTFAQLENEVETEEQDGQFCLRLSPESQRHNEVDTEWEGMFQRDSGSPMEATPADQTEQTDAVLETQAASKTPLVHQSPRRYTVERLVTGPDSLIASQATAAAQETKAAVSGKNPTTPQTPSKGIAPQCTEQDSEVTVISQEILPSGSETENRESDSASAGLSTKSPDIVKESLDSEANEEAHGQSSSSLPGPEEKGFADGKKEQQDVDVSCKMPCKKPEKRPTTPPSKQVSTVLISLSVELKLLISDKRFSSINTGIQTLWMTCIYQIHPWMAHPVLSSPATLSLKTAPRQTRSLLKMKSLHIQNGKHCTTMQKRARRHGVTSLNSPLKN